jgi:hypothetical protein
MRLFRIAFQVAATLACLSPVAVSAQTTTAKHSANDCKAAGAGFTTTGNHVTIFLHGIMVGRLKNYLFVPKSFDVGVIRRVQDHEFHLNIFAGKNCTSLDSVIPYHTKLIFRVVGSDGKPTKHDIDWYKASSTAADVHDPRFILNMEGPRVHGKPITDLYDSAYLDTFSFYNGSIKMEVPTNKLVIEKADGDRPGSPRDINAIAEVVGVEIDLANNQRLELVDQNNNHRPYWTNNSGSTPQSVEARILNLPSHVFPAGQCSRSAYASCMHSTPCPYGVRSRTVDIHDFLEEYFTTKVKADSTMGAQGVALAKTMEPGSEIKATHFQDYYYLVFKMDRPDRYELINPYEECISVTQKIHGVAKLMMTVPPYLCGMVTTGSQDQVSSDTVAPPPGEKK